MAPLLRRTWAPRGRTPILYQRGRSREKVSAIAALSVSPKRRRVGLYFSLAANRNVRGDWVVWFLRQLLRHLRGPVVLLWDRLGVHQSQLVGCFLERRPRLHREWFPPYAPELNPVEAIWGYVKSNPLANFAPHDTDELLRVTTRHASRLQRQPTLLRAAIRSTPLAVRLK